MKSKRERVLERALEMACQATVKGDCSDCPIKGKREYCPEWTGSEDCTKQLRNYLLRKAKAEGRPK